MTEYCRGCGISLTNMDTGLTRTCMLCHNWFAVHPDKPRPRVRWVISQGDADKGDSPGEFGVEIDGVPFWYYKYADPSPSPISDLRREIVKREFGETLHTSLDPFITVGYSGLPNDVVAHPSCEGCEAIRLNPKLPLVCRVHGMPSETIEAKKPFIGED